MRKQLNGADDDQKQNPYAIYESTRTNVYTSDYIFAFCFSLEDRKAPNRSFSAGTEAPTICFSPRIEALTTNISPRISKPLTVKTPNSVVTRFFLLIKKIYRGPTSCCLLSVPSTVRYSGASV